MTFEFDIKKSANPSHANSLLERRAVWEGPVADWNMDEATVQLSPADMAALQRKHGSKRVNYPRATAVKRMMVDGAKQARIIQVLKARGRGYGERMIKADHAALSGPIRRARKKVQ